MLLKCILRQLKDDSDDKLSLVLNWLLILGLNAQLPIVQLNKLSMISNAHEENVILMLYQRFISNKNMIDADKVVELMIGMDLTAALDTEIF